MDLNETWRGSDRDLVVINCCFLLEAGGVCTDPSQTLPVCAVLGALVFQSKMFLNEGESRLLNMHLKESLGKYGL